MNADDFGLTPGVNRAILELHQAGVLTSATLMARAPATAQAIEIAQAYPKLGVGCHVVLVDGEPMLSARQEIPNLVDPALGQFEPSLFRFLKAIYQRSPSRKIDYQIEREAAAQIASLQSHGLRLTHIDAHKHTHMFPRVLRPLLRAARSAGIRAVRNPFEPVWSQNATGRAPWVRRMEVRLLRLLESEFQKIVAGEGFATTDGAVGVLATGTLDSATVSSLIQKMPAGTWELVTHPGYNDADLATIRTRLLESRSTEREALKTARLFDTVSLITFADLPSSLSSIAT